MYILLKHKVLYTSYLVIFTNIIAVFGSASGSVSGSGSGSASGSGLPMDGELVSQNIVCICV